MHPYAGDLLQVGQGAEGAIAEWRPAADAFGLVQPDRRLRERIVISVADGPDRAGQPCQQQGLGEPDGGILLEFKGSLVVCTNFR